MTFTDIAPRGSRLTIAGSYGVPLGPIGKFGAAVVGHRLARAALDNLVEKLGRRLDTEAARRRASISYRPAPYNEDLRPSNHLGHRAG